jgi:hypothetical protein
LGIAVTTSRSVRGRILVAEDSYLLACAPAGSKPRSMVGPFPGAANIDARAVFLPVESI